VNERPIVSNSSPIIALDPIGERGLLSRLFSTIWVPPAVIRETRPTVALPTWVVERAVQQAVGTRVLRASLGQGESEAIALALETDARWILLDDRPARRVAEGLGLSVIGTLGILLACKRRGLLVAIRSVVDSLVAHGLRVSGELYASVLADASERS